MGQIEVYDWLRLKRQSKDDAFFTVKQIEEGLKQQGFSNGVLHGVRGDLISLEYHGYLEVELKGDWRDWKRTYRMKAKYAKK